MARVQRDPEERIADSARDRGVHRRAGLADPQRRIPRPDRLEVRPHEPIDVVADVLVKVRGILDDEAGAAVERAPDPEGDRERIAALDGVGRPG